VVVESGFFWDIGSHPGRSGILCVSFVYSLLFSLSFLFFMASSNIVFPKLVGTNYFYWRKRKKPIFIPKYLCHLLIDGYTIPSVDQLKTLSDDDNKSLK
jgi:hypothetical protein